MDAKEIIKRERITLREFRTALINVIEDGIGTAIKRLDEWEMRIEKENLSAPLTKPAPAEDPRTVQIYQEEIAKPIFEIPLHGNDRGIPAEEDPIDAAIIAPSLATANGSASSAPAPKAPEGGRS